MEYIKFLDDAAAQHDVSPIHEEIKIPSAPTDPRRWSGNSLPPQYEEGYEAVDREDVPSGSATGVAAEVAQRGWFAGWAGNRSVSSPLPRQTSS